MLFYNPLSFSLFCSICKSIQQLVLHVGLWFSTTLCPFFIKSIMTAVLSMTWLLSPGCWQVTASFHVLPKLWDRLLKLMMLPVKSNPTLRCSIFCWKKSSCSFLALSISSLIFLWMLHETVKVWDARTSHCTSWALPLISGGTREVVFLPGCIKIPVMLRALHHYNAS